MSDRPLFIPGSAGEHFGRVLRTRRAGRFLFRESRYRGSLHMPPHYHPRPYFSYVIHGCIRERTAGSEREYGAGTVHFHPAGDPHTAWLGAEGATCLSIIPSGEFAERILAPHGHSPRDATWIPAARLARRCHHELQVPDSASDLALEALGLEMLATFLRDAAPRGRRAPGWLLAVRDHLHACFAERIRLAELSALAGIHEVHLVRAFRRHFGVTPGAYVRELRVEHARRALLDSDTPIADLALAAGFASQAHFTRVFHRLAGATPAAYRRAARRRRP
jgi:AraC family transcriptional regulator